MQKHNIFLKMLYPTNSCIGWFILMNLGEFVFFHCKLITHALTDLFRSDWSCLFLLSRNDPLRHALPLGQPLLHVHRLRPEQHRAHPAAPHHPGLRLWHLLHPLRYPCSLPKHTIICMYVRSTYFFFYFHVFPASLCFYFVLSLVCRVSIEIIIIMPRWQKSHASAVHLSVCQADAAINIPAGLLSVPQFTVVYQTLQQSQTKQNKMTNEHTTDAVTLSQQPIPLSLPLSLSISLSLAPESE